MPSRLDYIYTRIIYCERFIHLWIRTRDSKKVIYWSTRVIFCECILVLVRVRGAPLVLVSEVASEQYRMFKPYSLKVI